MLQNFKKVNISNLIIDPSFDYLSGQKIVSLNSDGIDISIASLNMIRNISHLDSIKSIFETNFKICDVLNLNNNDKVNWKYLIGKESCLSYACNLKKEILFSKDIITTYHTEIFYKRKMLYNNLSQILDKDKNILEAPVYDHSGVSGRTSIKSGFNFLTSSKDFRKTCQSKIDGNMLVSVDFKSCEPNLYLRSIGKNIPNSDVYKYLVEELNIKVEEREKLKRGILSVLYGASDETASRILGGDKNNLNKIKEFFEIEKWTKELQKEFDEKKYIFNMYGRPIFSDKSILNKWIQSSAVDFCSLAFLNLVEEHDLKVAYLVHDDMVIDCTKDKFEKIKNIKALLDPYANISLPVEVTVLSA